MKGYGQSMDQADGFATQVAETSAPPRSFRAGPDGVEVLTSEFLPRDAVFEERTSQVLEELARAFDANTLGLTQDTPQTRGVRLPEDSAARKEIPIVGGVLDYFPDAIAELARLSKSGNDKHNPGQPLHWSRDKSDDHIECIGRHLVDRGKLDENGVYHDVMMAWRALANLQLLMERIHGLPPSRGAGE